MTKRDHQIIASWVFGGISFVFLLGVFILGPDELPPFKYKILTLVSSLLVGFFGYFLTGAISIEGKGRFPFLESVVIRSGGGIALFVLTMVWWSSPQQQFLREKLEQLTFELSDRPIRLGDNIFARIGGRSIPRVDSPDEQDSKRIIFFNKKTGEFHTSWGISDDVSAIANAYKKYYEGFNLGAWEDIVAFSPEGQLNESYPGEYVQIDGMTILKWERGKGNFYLQEAAVAYSNTFNIYRELVSNGNNPGFLKVKNATLYITGLHGGKRPGQDDFLELIVNGNRIPLSFEIDRLRSEETISVSVDPSLIPISKREPLWVAITTLPIQEKYPLPPKSAHEVMKGPAHFRDVEIYQISLKLEFGSKPLLVL